MNVKTISYRRGATLNIGSYEMVRIEVGMDADLDASEDPDAAYSTLKAQVDGLIRDEVADVRDRTNRRS